MKLFRRKRGQEETSSGWREAFSHSGHGIKVDRPKLPRNMELFVHLGVPKETRKRLQHLLMKYWTVRPESLVDDFLEIAFSHATKLIFPGELRETVLKHYDNPPTADALQRECAAVYVRHEMNRWRQRSDLEKWANEMGTAFVKWRTCQDERVCPVCQGYEDVLYPISKIPELPACWDCRCYYEPVVDMKYLQWPRKVYSNGKVSMMERKEFEQLF